MWKVNQTKFQLCGPNRYWDTAI